MNRLMPAYKFSCLLILIAVIVADKLITASIERNNEYAVFCARFIRHGEMLPIRRPGYCYNIVCFIGLLCGPEIAFLL